MKTKVENSTVYAVSSQLFIYLLLIDEPLFLFYEKSVKEKAT